MNEKELREKYPPRKLENQVEFENVMTEINVAQTHDDHPLLDEDRRLKIEFERLGIERAKLRAQMNEISIKRMEIDQRRKDMNRVYHDIKHEFIVLNPRSATMPTVQ